MGIRLREQTHLHRLALQLCRLRNFRYPAPPQNLLFAHFPQLGFQELLVLSFPEAFAAAKRPVFPKAWR